MAYSGNLRDTFRPLLGPVLSVAVIIGLAAVREATEPNPGYAGEVELDTAAEAEIRELMDVVAELRGLDWEHEPEIIILEPGYFDEAVAPNAEELEPTKEDHLYRALGQLDVDQSLASIQTTFTSEGIDGFYEPEMDALVVSGAIDDYTRVVIVHELAHALDAQHYDLTQIYDEYEPDELIALRGLMEGSATLVEDAYIAQMSGAERSAYDRAYEDRIGDIDVFEVFPPVFLATQSIPYGSGSWFVDALVAEGGEAAVADAYRSPPTTSAEILHPERYLAGAAAVSVDLPEPDGDILGKGVLGEARLLGLLAEGPASATEWADQAAGWAGDRYVLWSAEEQTCVALHVAVDTDADGDELEGGLVGWAALQPDASVERPAPELVALQSCSA